MFHSLKPFSPRMLSLTVAIVVFDDLDFTECTFPITSGYVV